MKKMDEKEIEAPQPGRAPEPRPDLSAYIGVAIVEWYKRYGERDGGGQPQADTAQTLAALADTAGALVARLPSRDDRRQARAAFEARFRRAHTALGQ